MENTKLSLADFKAKAEKVSKNEVLDKVQGGSDSSCHLPKYDTLDEAVQDEIKKAGF